MCTAMDMGFVLHIQAVRHTLMNRHNRRFWFKYLNILMVYNHPGSHALWVIDSADGYRHNKHNKPRFGSFCQATDTKYRKTL